MPSVLPIWGESKDGWEIGLAVPQVEVKGCQMLSLLRQLAPRAWLGGQSMASQMLPVGLGISKAQGHLDICDGDCEADGSAVETQDQQVQQGISTVLPTN